jgi:hypothetical protein
MAKAEARALVAHAIVGAAALRAATRPVITVRTNAVATGLLADDLAAVVRPGSMRSSCPRSRPSTR